MRQSAIALAVLVLQVGEIWKCNGQFLTAIALLVLHTGELGKCVSVGTSIAFFVTHTSKLGKCAPLDDCYKSPCTAHRGALEVCACW